MKEPFDSASRFKQGLFMKTYETYDVYLAVRNSIDVIKNKTFSEASLSNKESFLGLSSPGWISIFEDVWNFKNNYTNCKIVDLIFNRGGIRFVFDPDDIVVAFVQRGFWQVCRRTCMMTGKTYHKDNCIVYARKEIEDWPVLEHNIYLQYLNEQFYYNKHLIDQGIV